MACECWNAKVEAHRVTTNVEADAALDAVSTELTLLYARYFHHERGSTALIKARIDVEVTDIATCPTVLGARRSDLGVA